MSDEVVVVLETIPPVDAHPKNDKEVPYGWVVVLAAWLVMFIVLGAAYSFSVFIIPYTQYFHVGRGTVTWVGTIQVGMFPLVGPFVGRLADKYGQRRTVIIGSIIVSVAFALASLCTAVWQLYLTQGFLVGIGIAAAYFPVVALVSQWFNRRRGIAVGLAVSGSGIGSLVVGPVANLLIASVGWRRTLQIIAVSTAVIAILASTLLRRRGPTVRRGGLDLSLFRDRRFVYLAGMLFMAIFGYSLPFFHITPYARDLGMSRDFAALLLALLGAFGAVGRVVMGFIADRSGSIEALLACLAVMSISLFLWPLAIAKAPLVVFCVVFGFAGGGLISLLPVVASTLFEVARMSEVLGSVFFASSIPNFFGPVAAGYIFDTTGSYTIPIELYAGLMLLAILLLFLVRLRVPRPAEAQLEASRGAQPRHPPSQHPRDVLHRLCTPPNRNPLTSTPGANRNSCRRFFSGHIRGVLFSRVAGARRSCSNSRTAASTVVSHSSRPRCQ